MGKVLGYILAIMITLALLINAVSELFQAYGWAMFYVPALVIGGVGSAGWVTARLLGRTKRRELKQAAIKRRIAELEAARGIPPLTEGSCPACGAPLLLGAKYCSTCRKSVAPPAPRLCYKCLTRNLDDAIYCGACGAYLGDDLPNPHIAVAKPATAPRAIFAPAPVTPHQFASAGVIMPAIVLPTTEQAYRAWIAANPRGVVINARRDGSAEMTWHCATCLSIQPRKGQARVSGARIKACAMDLVALQAWVMARPERLTPCRMCRPERASAAPTQDTRVLRAARGR